MKNYKTLTALAAAGLLVTAGTAGAATLAYYFDGDYSTDSLSGSQLAVNADVTASDMSRVIFGGDAGGNGGTMRNSYGAASFTDSDATTGSFFFVYNAQNAPATTDDTAYMQFTVTAAVSGQFLDLSNITLDWAWGTDRAGDITSSLDVQASTDGSIFSTVTGSSRTESTGLVAKGDMGYFSDDLVIDMSSLANAASYTIRIRSADNQTNASFATNLFQNVTLNGDVVAVPEPSSFALLAGMFGLTWVMLRRR